MNGADDNSLVQFYNVNYSIPAPDGLNQIISDLNLTVERGETLVLLGESGCGKTTTLKLVNRLLTPSSGYVLVEGKSTEAWEQFRLGGRTAYGFKKGGRFPTSRLLRKA